MWRAEDLEPQGASDSQGMPELADRQFDHIGIPACGELLIHRVKNSDRNDRRDKRFHVNRPGLRTRIIEMRQSPATSNSHGALLHEIT